MLGGIQTTVSSHMSQNPAAANCGVSAAIVGKYSDLALPSVAAGVCTATVTMNSTTNSNVAGKTVVMTFDAATGLFTTSQATTGGTLAAKYTPTSWQ